jgi:peptidoglycan/LPS O-acetylase OafA/YrhL
VAPWPLYAAYVAVIGTLVATKADVGQTLPVIVSVGVLLLGRHDMLDKVFSNRPLQSLARISYSFYLIHSSIGWRWISLLQKLVGPSFGIAWGWIAFASACTICFIASDLMWRLIESPTMRFSKKIRLPVRGAAAAVPGVEPSTDGAVLAPVFAPDRGSRQDWS